MISLTSPYRTRAHGWPAGLKLGALCLGSTAVFLTDDLPVMAGLLAALALAYALPGRPFMRAGLRALRLVLPFVVIMLTWHLLTGEWQAGLLISMRMVLLVGLANLVTMTTSLQGMMGVMRWLLTPLRRLGLPTHLLETAVPLTIRFTPVLIARAEALALAWRARAARRPGWRLVLPLMMQALDDADHVGEALRARGGPLNPAQQED